MILIGLTSPFILFNTLYAWPKLLGAGYVLLAFLLLVQMSKEDGGRGHLARVALSVVMSYLAHASHAFARLPLRLWFMPTILRGGEAHWRGQRAGPHMPPAVVLLASIPPAGR